MGLLVLYPLAGVLLGVAALTLVFLSHLGDKANSAAFAFIGCTALGFGATLWLLRVEGPVRGVGQALLVASLLPLLMMGAVYPNRHGAFDAGEALLLAAGLSMLAMPWLPRQTGTAALLSSLTFLAALFVWAFRLWSVDAFIFPEPTKTGAAVIGSVALVHLLAMAIVARWARRTWRDAVVTALALTIALPVLLVLGTYFPNHPSRFYELLVGAFGIVEALAGLASRDRALMSGGATLASILAMVYAFDVNVWLGFAVLIGMAVAIVALAGTLKRLFRGRPTA